MSLNLVRKILSILFVVFGVAMFIHLYVYSGEDMLQTDVAKKMILLIGEQLSYWIMKVAYYSFLVSSLIYLWAAYKLWPNEPK